MDNYLHAWKRIGANQTVIEWIRNGVPIPLINNPSPFELSNHSLNFSARTFVRDEIERLLKNGYITQCAEKPRYLSPVGCVAKKSGGYRLITDFRKLNSYCQSCSFKQEDIRTVADIIDSQDYLTSVDLKDGFYHIRVQDSHQELLSFQFEGRYFSYVSLPFGFALSPYYFSKVLRPVVTYLRQLGVKLVLYVDDFLLCAKLSLVVDHTDLLLHTLEDLGLRVNLDKSVLTPAQTIKYLGYDIDTTGTYPVIRARKDRVNRIKRQIRTLLHKGGASARVIAKTTGLCVSVAWAVTPGKLFLRHLYRLLSTKSSWDDVLLLNSHCVDELQWWLQAIDSWNFREIKSHPVDSQLVTDASHLGWGARLGKLEAKGDWNYRVSCQSSNYRELLAILLAILAFRDQVTGRHIQILSDNVTALAYLRHKGGPSTDLTDLAVSVWAVAAESGLTLSFAHIAGQNNQEADLLSRTPDKHNWMLNPGIFQLIDFLWGPHTVDRFATLQNSQLPRFNSRYFEPLSEGIDALAQNWTNENNFVNPPWALLPQILEKITHDKATATIIAPVWPSQYWFPKLQSLLIDHPIYLPRQANTFWHMGVTPEPRRNLGWKVAVWRVSGHLVS